LISVPKLDQKYAFKLMLNGKTINEVLEIYGRKTPKRKLFNDFLLLSKEEKDEIYKKYPLIHGKHHEICNNDPSDICI